MSIPEATILFSQNQLKPVDSIHSYDDDSWFIEDLTVRLFIILNLNEIYNDLLYQKNKKSREL